MPNTNEILVEDKQAILLLIRDDKSFREKLSTVAPMIKDKIYTYFSNPNCTCKKNILEWLDKNIPQAIDLITEFKTQLDTVKKKQIDILNKNQATQQNRTIANIPGAPINPQQQSTLPQNIKSGETVLIDPSPEAYKQLFDRIRAEKWIFRGLNVLPCEVENEQKWCILFF